MIVNSPKPQKGHAVPDRRTVREQQIATAMPTTAMVCSQDILRGQSSVTIDHNGMAYRLQTTRQGKLILTK